MKNTAIEYPAKTWEKTKVKNLVRHKYGRYYARTFGNNKEIWKSALLTFPLRKRAWRNFCASIARSRR